MEILEDKIAELVKKTEEVVTFFYQEKQSEGYQKLDKVLGIIIELMNYLENIPEQEGSKQFLDEIAVTVREIFMAMEKKDSRDLADILQKRILGVPTEEDEKGFVLGDYYEENIEGLKTYSIRMYEKYIEWEKEEPEFQIEEIGTEDGSWTLRLQSEKGEWLLNSSVCPQREARAWGEGRFFKNLNQLVLLFGLGNGMIVQTLLEKGRSDMRLVIYEPSLEIFDYLLHRTRLSDIFIQKEVTLIVRGLNGNLLDTFLDINLEWTNLLSLRYFCHPIYKQIFEEQYVEYMKIVQEGAIRAKICENTWCSFGKDMVRNTCCSLGFLKNAQYMEQYAGRFASDIPAIIVAAGPSLDLNIDLLKEAKGKAVIIATDTAMRDLVAHHIEPDFIVTVDPRKPAEYLEDEDSQNVPLLCMEVANRKILERHKGVKVFYTTFPYFKRLKPDKIIDVNRYSGGSCVATAAFSVCATWGFKTVILIGQDLAYRNGVSHAGGRMSGEEKHGDWLVEVEDIYGNIIKTRHEWYMFIKWYENAIEAFKDKITVIDATEGGAKISGSEIMTLSEAIRRYCVSSIDCKSLVSEIPLAFGKEEYQKAIQYIEKSIEDNDKIYTDTKTLIVKAKKIISLCKRGQQGKEYNRIVKDVLRLGERVMKRPVRELLETWIEEDKEELTNIYSMEEENEIHAYEEMLQIYENLSRASREIKPILTETYRKMQENQ